MRGSNIGGRLSGLIANKHAGRTSLAGRTRGSRRHPKRETYQMPPQLPILGRAPSFSPSPTRVRYRTAENSGYENGATTSPSARWRHCSVDRLTKPRGRPKISQKTDRYHCRRTAVIVGGEPYTYAECLYNCSVYDYIRPA